MSFEFATHVRCDGDGYPYPGGAATYETELRRILTTVSATRTGRAVIGFFSLRHRDVTIVPFRRDTQLGEQQSPRDPNATGGSIPGHTLDGFRRGAPGRDFHGSVVPGTTGTGRGTDAVVRFTPLYFGNTPDAEADAVLVHELFHAMRVLFGMLERRPLGAGFSNAEELYSIFVENMYRLEKGYALRMTHSSSSASPDHSMAHNPIFHAPMRVISEMMPTIVNTLARIDIRYNPFRDWLAFRQSHPAAGH